MSADDSDRPEAAIVAAVATLHARGFEGIRITANFYATGHWRCRVLVPDPGDASGPAAERNVLLAYSNSLGWDLFRDGRTEWDVDAIAGRLAAAAQAYPGAFRADREYVAWLAELRRRTNGGWFAMYEDAYVPQQMWDRRGLVRLVYPDRRSADADAAAYGGVDENGWSLVGTAPAPPAP